MGSPQVRAYVDLVCVTVGTARGTETVMNICGSISVRKFEPRRLIAESRANVRQSKLNICAVQGFIDKFLQYARVMFRRWYRSSLDPILFSLTCTFTRRFACNIFPLLFRDKPLRQILLLRIDKDNNMAVTRAIFYPVHASRTSRYSTVPFLAPMYLTLRRSIYKYLSRRDVFRSRGISRRPR